MLPCMLLTAALAAGQTEGPGAEQPGLASPPAATVPTPEASKAAADAPAPPLPDRWLLMKTLQGTWPGALLDGNRMQVTGWVDTSFTASTDTQTNLPLGFNHRANEFLVQQNWVRIERTVVTSGTTEPTFGFRNDWILPGSDYRFMQARGLLSDQLVASNGRPNLYGIDPIAFYGEGYFPTVGSGLDVKLGRFFAQVGVEANDAPSNALCSHSYTFIYNPFTHAGVLATLKLTSAWSVYGGLVLGSDVFIDPASRLTGIAGFKWLPDPRNSLACNAIVGPGRFDAHDAQNNLDVFDLVYTHRFNARLNYTFDAMFSVQTDVPHLGTIDSLGVTNYLTYTFSPRLSGTTRLEFFNDAQGQRTGFAGLYTAFTAGLSFQPLRAITVRPELRYDYNGQSAAFEDKHGLFTAAADVILRW